MSSTLRRRWTFLIDDLQNQNKVLVAFSAGCDSTFLLAAARRVLPKENIFAVTASSGSLAHSEREESSLLAKKIDVDHLFLETNEFANPNYVANRSNRCFFCKDELYGRLRPIADARGMTLMDGFNLSDRGEIRPGVQAAEKWGVTHPLDRALLRKSDIRTLSRWLGLPTWNKPASPCLSSRIPFGTPVTREALQRIEQAEGFLKNEGFPVVRVRHYDQRARIEVPINRISQLKSLLSETRVHLRFYEIGYLEIDVDLRGFRSGSLNKSNARMDVNVESLGALQHPQWSSKDHAKIS